MKKLLSIALLCVTASVTALADDGWQDLFDGKSLNGWTQVGGTAKYHVENETIVGTSVSGSPNSFVRSDKTYGDFILEFDAWIDTPLNSGVQFRSLVGNPEINRGRVHGYQLELDTSPRSWTGGIFDEGRYGWLFSLSRNEPARAAFKADTWNHFRVEAIGNNLKSWINGVPAANVIVDFTDEGFIALQVHSIGGSMEKLGKQVRWKNIRIKTTDLETERSQMSDTVDQYNYLPNTLTKRQKSEGWKLLFDGKTGKGWKSAKADGFPTSGWQIEDGVLSVLASDGKESQNGGDIITEEQYSNFELELDFRLTEGANSGIKYFVDPNLLKVDGSAIGLEYQVLDDAKHPQSKTPLGSVYLLYKAVNMSEPGRTKKRVNSLGKWNRVRIVVKGNHVEHWLNNSKLVDYERGSEEFRELVSKTKFNKYPGYGELEKGHILLQDHGNRVDFRSVKIRVLGTSE